MNPGGYGGLAQLGERLICIQEVNGSIPLFSTNFITYPSSRFIFKPMKCLKMKEEEERNGMSFRRSRKRVKRSFFRR